MEVQLRAIEGTVTRIDLAALAGRMTGGFQRRLGLIPDFNRADIFLFRTG